MCDRETEIQRKKRETKEKTDRERDERGDGQREAERRREKEREKRRDEEKRRERDALGRTMKLNGTEKQIVNDTHRQMDRLIHVVGIMMKEKTTRQPDKQTD